MKLTFKESQPVQGGITSFIFTPEEGTTWTPGQFTHFTLPHDNVDDRGDERWFTISSAPYEGVVTISTRINTEKGSSFKETLSGLNPGDVIEADSPEGSFTLNDENADYVFAVGGIGVTPIHSILKQLHHDGKNPNIELVYANRSEDTTPFKDELESIAKDMSGLNITYLFGDKLIDETVLKEAGNNLNNPTYYITGPEPMVEALEKTVENAGIASDRAKFDYFPGYEISQR